jgi:hypothetical protein
MTAQIIDFAQKKREKREREFLQTDVTELSPEELKQLSLSLRMHIIGSAIERGDEVYKQHLNQLLEELHINHLGARG